MNSQTILKLFVSSGLWRAAGSVMVLIVTLVIAKKLGAESAGLYFLSFAIISFVANVSRCGVDNAVLKLVSISSKQEKQGFLSGVIASSLFYSGFTGTIMTLLICLTSETISISLFERKELSDIVISMSPYIVLSSLCVVIAMVLQGMEKLKKAVLITNIITNSVFFIFLLMFDVSDLYSIIKFLLLSVIINLGVALLLIKRNLSFNSEFFNAFGQLLTLSFPLFIIVLCGQSNIWMSQIILGIYSTNADVSNYAIAQRLSMVMTFFLVSLNIVVAPKYARLFKENDQIGIRKLVKLSGRVNVLVSVPLVLTILCFSDYLFAYFGDGYDNAADALIILAIGQFFNALTGSVSYLLSMTGNEKILRNNAILTTIFMISLCLVLIPSFGVFGAAIAASCSVTLNNLMNVISVKNQLGINCLKFF